MTLPDRLEQIIREQGISKAEFARRMGISCNYIYVLTGSRGRSAETPAAISTSLAKLIALEFGYNEEWIVHGTGEAKKIGDTVP